MHTWVVGCDDGLCQYTHVLVPDHWHVVGVSDLGHVVVVVAVEVEVCLVLRGVA
jgi:hypothetical protein